MNRNDAPLANAALDTSKVAELLESVADYVDAIESERSAKTASERNARISKLASRYENATGETLPDTVRSKLAGIEVDALEHLLKIANNSDGSPDSLGNPAELNDNTPPRTAKEAAAKADDNFLNWILS